MRDSGFVVRVFGPASFSPILTVVNIVFVLFVGSSGGGSVKDVFVNFTVLVCNVSVVDSTMGPLTRIPRFAGLLLGFSGPLLNIVTNTLLATIVRSSSTSMNVLRTLYLANTMPFDTTVPVVVKRGVKAYVATVLSTVKTGGGTGHTTTMRLCFGLVNAIVFVAIFCLVGTIIKFSFFRRTTAPTKVTIVRDMFGIATAVVLLPFTGKLRGLTYLAVQSGGRSIIISTRSERFVVLRPHFLRGPTFTMRRDHGTTEGVTRRSRGTLFATLDLISGCDRRNMRYIRGVRSGISHCRSRLKACLIGLDRGSVSRTSDRDLSVVLRYVKSFRHVSSRTMGVVRSTRRLCRGKLGFSRGTGGSLRILKRTMRSVMGATCRIFSGRSVGLTRGVRPLRRIVSRLSGRMGHHRMRELEGNRYAVRVKFVLSSVAAYLRHITSRYSGVKIYIARIGRSLCSARDRLGVIGDRPSRAFCRRLRSTQVGCRLSWGWANE